MPDKKENILSEPQADYEKTEMDLLRQGLKRTYKERFEMMMTLVRWVIMMQPAKITHKPYTFFAY